MKKTFLAAWLIVGLTSVGAEPLILNTEFQDTQPKFISRADGSFGGLCLELMALMEQKSEFRFSYPKEFVPVGRISGDLRSGSIDVYFGLAKTAQREKDFKFVGELSRTRYQLVARRGDPLLGLASLEQFRTTGLPIMAIRGTAQANYDQATLGLPIEDAPTAVETALLQLKAGKASVFGYYDLGNAWFLATAECRDHLAPVPIVLDEDAQWLCARATLPQATVTRISQVLEGGKMAPEWTAVMKKYFPGR